MEENIKIAHTKNLNKFSFNTTLSVPINASANIKTIIDLNTYLFDVKVECGNGKAIISGKIGMKVLYLDTDNMTSTLSDTVNFSETYSDNLITSDTFLNLTNQTIVNNVLSTESVLKINCEVSLTPIAYVNLAISPAIKLKDSIIAKKREFSTCVLNSFVNTSFEHTLNIDTKDEISKILCCNSYFSAENITPNDGFMVIDGKLLTCLMYETTNGDDRIIKEIKETSNVKCDVEMNGLTKEHNLDLTFNLNKSREEIQTELEDNSSVITVKNSILINGVVLNPVSIEVVDDLFSVENEIEAISSKRECTKNVKKSNVSEIVFNEINLSSDEPAIDEVISNLNQNAEITNTYIKNKTIHIEGLISSNLIYIDENKEIKNKQLDIPFIINTKLEAETLGCVHSEIFVVDCKIKVKRGTIIEVEYSVFSTSVLFEKEEHEMIDNFTIGKQLDFSKYDFQIFVAKPNETTWELCKRIKISPNDISKYNKDLPPVMVGGEKVVIKR